MSLSGEREAALWAALDLEPDWQALLRHFDFNEGFAFILILVESAENAAFCREALRNYLNKNNVGTIRRILCNYPGDAQKLPYLLHKPAGLDNKQTLWIESVIPEHSVTQQALEEWRAAWRVCFSSLNQIRNQMQHTIPGALVFAVAPWVQQILRNVAPDLWSIRSTVVEIAPRTTGSRALDVATPLLQRPESDPTLAPDPEFAEQEASRLTSRPGTELARAQILQRAGEGYLVRAEPNAAIRVLREAETLQVGASGSNSHLSQTKTLLGRAYKLNAQWEEAEACFRDALEMDRARLGEENPDIATDLCDLAQLLAKTNRVEEAEPLYRHALEIQEKASGLDHERVASTLNNLAEILRETGRYQEAEPLYLRALDIYERNYGHDHPRLATTLNNLGLLLTATDRLSEAEAMYRRALTTDEKYYGPDHPEVAVDLNNLALLMKVTNRMEEAEELFRRALRIEESRLGPDHPGVAQVLNNLAELLRETGRNEEAEPMYLRALAIDEHSYGQNHPSVASRLNNLARLLEFTGREEEAEPVFQRALSILQRFEARTGHIHPRFSAVSGNYRQLLHRLGRPIPDTPKTS